MEVQALGYLSKVQVIQRSNENRQYYLICPAPLAQALELQKGEEIEWVIRDKNTFEIRRQGSVNSPGKEKKR